MKARELKLMFCPSQSRNLTASDTLGTLLALWGLGLLQGCGARSTSFTPLTQPSQTVTIKPTAQPASPSSKAATHSTSLPAGVSRLTQNIADPVESLAFSPDSKLLAVDSGVSSDGHGHALATLQLFDIQTRKVVKTLTTESGDIQSVNIRCLAFSPDESRVAIGDGYNEVYIWSVTTGKRLHHIRLPFPLGAPDDPHVYVYSLAFSPDGKDLLASNYVLNARTGKVKWTIPDSDSALPSPDGRFVASCVNPKSSNATEVWMWNARSHRLVYHLPFNKEGHGAALLGFTPQRGTQTTLLVLRSGYSDSPHDPVSQVFVGGAHLAAYDLKGKSLFRLPLRAAVDSIFAFSLDSKRLATVNSDAVVLTPLQKSTPNSARDILKIRYQTGGVAFSSDGHTLAIGGYKEVLLWKLAP